jgi:hypothetical protein
MLGFNSSDGAREYYRISMEIGLCLFDCARRWHFNQSRSASIEPINGMERAFARDLNGESEFDLGYKSLFGAASAQEV